jgi:hypothetical protein
MAITNITAVARPHFLKNRNTSLQSLCGLLTFFPVIQQGIIPQVFPIGAPDRRSFFRRQFNRLFYSSSVHKSNSTG